MLNVKNIVLSLLIVMQIGCASRSQIREDNPIKEVSNLYNRNFVVAAPTYVGNVVCGAPFLLISGLIDSAVTGKRSKAYYDRINNLYLVPASVCGAITGLLFVPFSYLCDESPWIFDFKSTQNQTWKCREKESKSKD
jgi:hypothetical protein